MRCCRGCSTARCTTHIKVGGCGVIEKIIKLQGIGLLHDPLPSGAVVLSETVAVYSDNGRGKSTLAAVLRAAASGEIEELSARTTLGGTKEAACELLIDGSVLKYDGTSWTESTDTVLVFDAAVIERKVHVASSAPTELATWTFRSMNAASNTSTVSVDSVQDVPSYLRTDPSMSSSHAASLVPPSVVRALSSSISPEAAARSTAARVDFPRPLSAYTATVSDKTTAPLGKGS